MNTAMQCYAERVACLSCHSSTTWSAAGNFHQLCHYLLCDAINMARKTKHVQPLCSKHSRTMHHGEVTVSLVRNVLAPFIWTSLSGPVLVSRGSRGLSEI
jgi:hypothetical protein